jgi:hypothetical protein
MTKKNQIQRGKGKLHHSFVRKARDMQGSLYICLPRAYCEQNNIISGSTFVLVPGRGGDMRLVLSEED